MSEASQTAALTNEEREKFTKLIGRWNRPGFSPCAVFPLPPLTGLYELIEEEAKRRKEAGGG